jgi:hypothetical protein
MCARRSRNEMHQARPEMTAYTYTVVTIKVLGTQ